MVTGFVHEGEVGNVIYFDLSKTLTLSYMKDLERNIFQVTLQGVGPCSYCQSIRIRLLPPVNTVGYLGLCLKSGITHNSINGLGERIGNTFIAFTETTKVNIKKRWGRGVEFKTIGEKWR